jgi:hypothetical protein
MIATSSAQTLPASDTRRRANTLARSVYREMQLQGFTPEQMIAVSSELISLVGDNISGRHELSAAE